MSEQQGTAIVCTGTLAALSGFVGLFAPPFLGAAFALTAATVWLGERENGTSKVGPEHLRVVTER